MVTSEELPDYKELQSYQGFLNCVFEKYKSFRTFLNVMHPTFDSWSPHQDPGVWKKDPDGLDDENLGVKAEKSFDQLIGTSSKGATS